MILAVVGSASDSRAKGPGFDHILSVLLPLIQERQLSKNWRKYVHEVRVNRLGGLSLSRKSLVTITDRHDMTVDVK